METVRITGIGSELQGVGKTAEGMTVFVPGALPGELVELSPVRTAKRYMEARLERVLEASPERRERDCPLFGVCGGCSGRHMRYDATLRFKRQRLTDALKRIAGLDEPVVRPTIGCPATDRLRNKAEFAIGPDGSGRILAGPVLKRGHQVLETERCLLHPEAVNRAMRLFDLVISDLPPIDRWKNLVCRVNEAGKLMLILCGRTPPGELERAVAARLQARMPELVSFWYIRQRPGAAHATDGQAIHLWGERRLEEALCGLSFSVSPQSFFQVNTKQAERLYQIAIDAALEGVPGGRLLDLYCGTGTISLCAANRGAKVTGVEIVPPAIEDARANAEKNHLSDRSTFLCADAAKALPGLLRQKPGFDCILLDPPRRGVDRSIIEALVSYDAPRIVYVSCDPGTLARDLGLLKEAFRVEWVQPVDMFPWTEHVETVVLMSRVKD